MRYPSPSIVAVTLLTVLPVLAQAQDPQPTVLHACYIPQSGVAYRVGEPGLRSETAECVSQSHVLFSWNAEGPLGPQEPAGPPWTMEDLRVVRFTLQPLYARQLVDAANWVWVNCDGEVPPPNGVVPRPDWMPIAASLTGSGGWYPDMYIRSEMALDSSQQFFLYAWSFVANPWNEFGLEEMLSFAIVCIPAD